MRMRVLRVKTQTAANIKFQVLFPMEYTERYTWNAKYANIYTYKLIIYRKSQLTCALASLAQ